MSRWSFTGNNTRIITNNRPGLSWDRAKAKDINKKMSKRPGMETGRHPGDRFPGSDETGELMKQDSGSACVPEVKRCENRKSKGDHHETANPPKRERLQSLRNPHAMRERELSKNHLLVSGMRRRAAGLPPERNPARNDINGPDRQSHPQAWA